MITVDERDPARDPIGRFLLGAASEEERQQVEARLFADDEFLAELQDREDALVDDYAQGRLAEGDRAAFERRFLASPQGRARVAFARAAARLAPPAAPARTWAPAWLPAAAAVVFAIAAGVLGLRAVRLGDELADERSRASAREQDLTRRLDALKPTPQASSPPAFVLQAQGTRSAGEIREMKARGSGTVVLAVPLPAARYTSYQAVLRTPEGALVWEDAGLQPEDPNLRVTVPGTALPPGDYILTLSGRRRTGPAVELADHYFRVVG